MNFQFLFTILSYINFLFLQSIYVKAKIIFFAFFSKSLASHGYKNYLIFLYPKIIYHAITINFIMSPLSIKGHSQFFYIKLTILRPIIGIKQSKPKESFFRLTSFWQSIASSYFLMSISP